jgi:hypothetical protein
VGDSADVERHVGFIFVHDTENVWMDHLVVDGNFDARYNAYYVLDNPAWQRGPLRQC